MNSTDLILLVLNVAHIYRHEPKLQKYKKMNTALSLPLNFFPFLC